MVRTPGVGIAILLGLAACGGASPPAPMPAEPPSVCTADPAVAATRRPKPDGVGCMDADAMTALGAACNAADADACYRLTACGLLGELGAAPNPTSVSNHRAALRVACDGGIAEACTMRVAVAMADGSALPADGCPDLVRSCRLGDEQGCFDCRNACE